MSLGRACVCALGDHAGGRRGRLCFIGRGVRPAPTVGRGRVREVLGMPIHMLGGVLCLLLLMGGCATEPIPGAVGKLSGPLRSIEL